MELKVNSSDVRLGSLEDGNNSKRALLAGSYNAKDFEVCQKLTTLTLISDAMSRIAFFWGLPRASRLRYLVLLLFSCLQGIQLWFTFNRGFSNANHLARGAE